MHRRANRSRWALLFLCGLLVSCAKRESRVGQGTREGILHIGNGADPMSLDPHLTTGMPEFNILSALMEGLIRLDAETLEVQPAVAERWDISEDGLEYTFFLREDARWSNGDPVTAMDFVFAYRRLLNPLLGGQYADKLYLIKNGKALHSGERTDPSELGVFALDSRILQITLERPAPYFLPMLNHHGWFPLHAASLREHGEVADRMNSWARPGNFVGNGPFVLNEWKSQEYVRVERNPHYWGEKDVRLNGIVFYALQDQDLEERQFRNQELHVSHGVPISKVPAYVASGNPVFQTGPSLGTYYYRLNTDRKPFDDVRVRQALSLALNRETLVKRVLRGGQQPARWFTPAGITGFEPDEHLVENVERARELLKEAGFPGGQGFPKFELLYNTSESHRQLAEVIQQMWKQNLGIESTLLNQEWKVYLNACYAGEYDVSRAGWIGDYMDPHNFVSLFASDSGDNNTGWANADYDALLEKADRTRNPEERFAVFAAAEHILLNEMPIIPLYWYTRHRLIQPGVHGLHHNVLDYKDWRGIWLEAMK